MAILQRQCEARVGLENRHTKTGPCDLAADRSVLLRAARLGRRRHYNAAAAMLETLPAHSPLLPSILDLKAKMLAQQGRYLKAEACWRQALQLVPNNQAFQRAIATIAGERRYPVWLRIAVAAVVAAVTSVAALAAVFAILRWTGRVGW